MTNIEVLLQCAEKYAEDCIRIRRDLHMYPEAGWTEFRTTAKVLEYLETEEFQAKLGTDIINPEYVMAYPEAEELTAHRFRAISQGADRSIIRRMEEKGGYTGAMFTIEGAGEGPTVILRFDMDCMGVEEPKDSSHYPYSMDFDSRNAGFMHACGHDAHTAMGMVLTRILYENRHLLKGRVKVVFQPAEEGVKGAYAMTRKGIADDGDFALGIHIYPSDGPYTALAGTQTGLYATRKWDVSLTGKTAHAGGAPQEGNHAIMAAVNAISAMNGFLQDGRGVGRLNVGTIEGGTARNVIPGYCRFQAESRGSETVVEERIFQKAEGCVKAAADMFSCEYEIKTTGMSPAGGGDTDLAAEIAAAVSALVPEFEKTSPVQVNTGTADDFCFFMERVHANGGKACYMALQAPLAAGLHNSYYDFDESVLLAGVKACLAALQVTGTAE